MPVTGLSGMYVGKYNNNGGVISYTNGMKLTRAVNFSSSIDQSDGNDLYADNGVAETDSGIFTGGTISVEGTEILPTARSFILGEKTEKIKIGEKEYDAIVSDETASAPNLGFGFVRQSMYNGIPKYEAVILTKIAFSIPDDEANTREENIDWQTVSLSARIMRDDSAKHRWRLRISDIEDEASAIAIVKDYLGVTDQLVEA